MEEYEGVEHDGHVDAAVVWFGHEVSVHLGAQ